MLPRIMTNYLALLSKSTSHEFWNFENNLRFFDKDEDGKLSVEELREIMVRIGDHPVTEEEFQDFLTVFF